MVEMIFAAYVEEQSAAVEIQVRPHSAGASAVGMILVACAEVPSAVVEI
jgi:hypothetical protein